MISESQSLKERLKAFDERLATALHNIPDTQNTGFQVLMESLLFVGESYAWTVLNLGRAALFQGRLEMPRSDSEIFACLQRADRLTLEEARQLKQFCELRHLASRDPAQLNVLEVIELLRSHLEITRLCGKFFQKTV